MAILDFVERNVDCITQAWCPRTLFYPSYQLVAPCGSSCREEPWLVEDLKTYRTQICTWRNQAKKSCPVWPSNSYLTCFLLHQVLLQPPGRRSHWWTHLQSRFLSLLCKGLQVPPACSSVPSPQRLTSMKSLDAVLPVGLHPPIPLSFPVVEGARILPVLLEQLSNRTYCDDRNVVYLHHPVW